MKAIFAAICLTALIFTSVFGQNNDNNTYTDNTILGGTSDDIFYSDDNNSSKPPQSQIAFDKPNYQNNNNAGPGNSDNTPAGLEMSNSSIGRIAFNNPDYQPNPNIGAANSDNSAAVPEASNPPSGSIAFDNPNYQNNPNVGPGNSDNNAAVPEPGNPPSGNIAFDNPAYNNATASNNSNYNTGDDNSAYVNPDNNSAPTYQTFYNQLSPYGTWRYMPGYGNVWAPAGVSSDFSPYVTAGQWVNTEYGWTWVSDYAWGSAPFHYGRWFRDASYGWLWAPGYQWAPAWVAWGNCNGYYCWAPLGPGFGFGYYRPAFAYWNFIPRGYLGYGRPGNYLVNRSGIFNGGVAHISLVNEAGNFRNSRFFAGPGATEVARYSGRAVNRVSMAAVNHATAAHFNNTAQANHLNNNANRATANNYNSRSATAPANRGNSNYSTQAYRNAQQANRYTQSSQQHYATQQNTQRQTMQGQRNYSSQQALRSNPERNFASAQRSAGMQRSMPSGGFHGGGSPGHASNISRGNGGSHGPAHGGGGGGHGHR